MTAAAAIDHHQSAKLDPLLVFKERCEARAILIAEGYLDFETAVVTLQAIAKVQGLVAQYGQDHVQEIMASSFARWL